VDEFSDGNEVFLSESTRGERGRPDADPARDEGGLVAGDRVLVEGDVSHLEHRFDL